MQHLLAATTPEAGLRRLRLILVTITVLTCLGGLAELVTLKHWYGVQKVPLIMLGCMAAAGVLLAVARATWSRRIAQAMGGLGMAGAAFGMYEHIRTNMVYGEYDAILGDRWATLSVTERFWHAATGAVGNTPALAPGMMGLAGLLLIVVALGPELTGKNSPELTKPE